MVIYQIFTIHTEFFSVDCGMYVVIYLFLLDYANYVQYCQIKTLIYYFLIILIVPFEKP